MYRFFDDKIINYINNCPDRNSITEIRLRAGLPVQFTINGKTETAGHITISQQQLDDILYSMCSRSINVYEEDISQGFVTLSDGSRVGIGGEFHYSTTAGRYLLKKLASLNIRIARNATYFINQDRLFERQQKGTLVVGKPHSGKTSLLKIYAKFLSQSCRIVICDERKEIYAQNINCDVLQGIKKADAILMATRTLNPQFIICDEIGSMEESQQILSAVNTGVKFICSAHGDSIEQVTRRPSVKILADNGVFERYLLLKQRENSFEIERICDV